MLVESIINLKEFINGKITHDHVIYYNKLIKKMNKYNYKNN